MKKGDGERGGQGEKITSKVAEGHVFQDGTPSHNPSNP